MATRRQWVAWRWGKERAGGKREKLPINPHTDRMAKSNDPDSWGTLGDALGAVEAYGLDGIGFVLTADDPIVFVDLDGCREPGTGEVAPWALKAIGRLGSYAEVSPSGTGVHVYALGALPGKGVKTAHVEMYDRGRFCTVSGDVLGAWRDISASQEAVGKLYARIGSKADDGPRVPGGAVSVALEDEELLDKARAGAKFRKLYDGGDWEGYESQSSADAALCTLLAFWTGRDAGRIERLFDASALGQRAKWRSRADYRESTISYGIGRCERVYDPEAWRGEVSPALDETLGRVHSLALAVPWTGRTGPGERWVLHALLTTARTTGATTEKGVTVSASSRHLALLCGKHRQRVEPLLKKLQERGWVRLLSKGSGTHGSLYLLPLTHASKCCQEGMNTGWGDKSKCCQERNSPYTTPPVVIFGNTLTDALARARNPPPQIEKEYDKNGRPIWQESRYLFRDLGDMAALLIEKVAARPGMDLAGLSEAMGRDHNNVRRAVSPIVEGGFLEERDGGYFPAEKLTELVERHLDASGSADREEKLRKKYREERERYRQEYEEALREQDHADRLRDAALACGVEPEDLDADGPEDEEETVGSLAEVVALALSILPPPEERVIPPPIPGRDPLVHRDTAKARLYRENRERREARRHERSPPRRPVFAGRDEGWGRW